MTQLEQKLYPDFSTNFKEWEKRPARYFLRERSVSVGKDWETTQLLSLTKQGVIDRDIDSGIGKYPASFEGYQLVEPGNLVFCLFDVEETPRTVGLVKNRGMITSAYSTYAVNQNIADPRFLEYFFVSVDNAKRYRPFYSGLRNTIPRGALLGTKLSLPPIEEQKAIADYLERELGLIDLVASKQQSLLSLIKERKLAAIQAAITAEADSQKSRKRVHGTWFSSVPEDWQVLQIRRLSPVKRGSSPRPIDDPKYFDEQGEWSWVRIADASAAQGKLQQTTQRLSELGASLSTKLLPGSLFVSIAGSVGKPCITEIKCCIHDGFVYFPNLSIDAMWLYRIFEAGLCFAGLGKLGTQLNLNTDTIGSITVPIPPPSEMGRIIRGIEQDSRRFDELIFSVEQLLEVLAERKQALINSAVTGKIDVRAKN